MKLEAAEDIVNAVLYEGYVLYPYRPSSVKNRQRWTFGGLYPKSYSEAQGGFEPYFMQTECLVAGNPQTTIEIRVRFLHLLAREVREMLTPSHELPHDIEQATRPVDSLWVGEKLYQTWQEATEREAGSAQLKLHDLISEPYNLQFAFPNHHDTEILRSSDNAIVGSMLREQQNLTGAITASAVNVQDGLFKVTVQITNLTEWQATTSDRGERDDALLRAFASTHTILGVQSGEFVSLLDTPDAYKEAATNCKNIGAWPVLVGHEGEHDIMLSSPIILYDYPQIAPESHGNLFDGTEIDEILTLRIMTLTEEEKREMRAVDERAGALLDRTESLTGEQMMQLHGTIRSALVKNNPAAPESGKEA
ncbi:MAG: hypothetical protein ABIQ44_05235 [Chloroflexia bacterium]